VPRRADASSPDAASADVPVEVLDALAESRPDGFVAAREAEVKRLRAEGLPAIATAVHALRRPSLVVWSVNQAARHRGDLVEALFAASDALRDAVTAGDGAAIRTEMRTRRALVGELADAALEHAAEVTPNPATHRDAILSTWDAASADLDQRAVVAAGHLTRELTPSDDLGDWSVAAPASATRHQSSGTRSSRAALPRDELALRRAEEALTAAREELAAASTEVDDADHAVAEAERAAAKAREAQRRAQAKVERAEATAQAKRGR
jgi:hypothetical protein